MMVASGGGGGGGGAAMAGAPVGGAPTLSYLFQLLHVITGAVSILETARADCPDLVPDCLSLNQNAAGAGAGVVVTSSRIPFEPAIDTESGAVFLGGGVGIAAAPTNVVRHKGRSDAQSAAGTSVLISFARPSISGASATNVTKAALDQARRAMCNSTADASVDATAAAAAVPGGGGGVLAPDAAFRIQVACLGLWSNYRVSHPRALHPKDDNLGEGEAVAEAVAEVLRWVLPDGYCRRKALTRAQACEETLGRPDWAPLFVDDPPASVIADVRLFNGDRFDGAWRFGRRHGKGVYHFASGSRYEGTWEEGKMVGWGKYILVDGTIKNIRH